tara:strand:- start:65071 stop:65985 length:915 start_codon:yes stop_codon:yes gene_type:complete
MSKTNAKGSLKDRIAAEDARKSSRGAAPKPPGGGRVSLPAGIESGVAKLTRVDFNVIESGPYEGSQRLYVHGVVVEPKEHEGQKTEGLLAQPGQITLDDVKSQYGDTSFAENVAKAENRLKLLGFPTSDFDDLEEDTLLYFNETDEMYFSFRTWKPNDSDRIITMINGPTEYVAKAQDQVVEADPHYSNNQATATPVTNSLQTVAKNADNGDENAQRTIVAKASAAGIDPEDEKYSDWASVVDAIENSTTTAVEAGDVWSYTPEGKTQLDVEIVTVDSGACEVRDLQSGDVYKNVSVTNLVEIA